MEDKDYDHDSLTFFVYRILNCIFSHFLHSHSVAAGILPTIWTCKAREHHHKLLLTAGHKTQVTHKVFYNTQLTVEDTRYNGQNKKQTKYKTPVLHRTEEIQHVQEGTQSEQNSRICSCEKTQ